MMDSRPINAKTPRQRRYPKWRRAIKAAAISLAVLSAILIAAITALTLWLSPDNLTGIVNSRASEYFNADIRAHNIRFTIWSSFPRLHIEADSVSVVSRNLRELPDSLRSTLPPGADFLASTGHISGAINVLDLLQDRITLRGISVDSLCLNLVSLNDSLNNYAVLPPSPDGKTHIPEFSADTVRILNPFPVKYHSVATHTSVTAALLDPLLTARPERHNTYLLTTSGTVSAVTSGLEVIRSFPFSLKGDIRLAFRPFSASLDRYDVRLGDITGHLSLRLDLENEPSVRKLRLDLDNFNPFPLLDYFPAIDIPIPAYISSGLQLCASAVMSAPYSFSSNVLPSLTVTVAIPPCSIGCRIDHRSIPLRLVPKGFSATLLFDGNNPGESSVIIPPFTIVGDGIDLCVDARINHLFGEPMAKINLRSDARLDKISTLIPTSSPLLDSPTCGRLHLAAEATLSLPSLDKATADISGTLTLTGLKATLPRSACLHTDSVAVRFASLLHLAQTSSLPPLRFSLSAPRLRIVSPGDSMTALFTGVDLAGILQPSTTRAGIPSVSSEWRLRRASITLPGSTLGGERLAATVTCGPRHPRHTPVTLPSHSDSLFLTGIRHTPEWIKITPPSPLAGFLNRWELAATLSVPEGRILSEAFPSVNRLHSLDIGISTDSIEIRSLSMTSRTSGFRLKGAVRGLRPFLSGNSRVPLDLRLDVAFDTINLNELAGTYLRGVRRKRGSLPPAPRPEPSDSVCALVPRNIRADISLSAKETVYTNLHLFDLSAILSLADGNATVTDLGASASFGHARADISYTTADARNLILSLNAGLHDVDIVRFFEKYHTLLLMMPQMSNLAGSITARADASMGLFPDMAADVTSLRADIGIDGDSLRVHQNGFIHRLARMIMIRTRDDIRIRDMRVRASIHDNILELYPFDFSFDRYLLRMGGVNNFAGDLYYHIGVLRSPVPFPFGINITGQFSHPSLSFGGASFSNRDAGRITSRIAADDRVNIIQEARALLHEMIVKAAESDTVNSTTDFIQ